MSSAADDIIEEIRRLSDDEQDPPVRAFFEDLLSIADEVGLDGIIENILQERTSVSKVHLPYLLFVSLQYLTDFRYDTPQSGSQLLQDLREHREEVVRLCQTKNVSTNVPERYYHLQIILEIIDKPVKVADLGSSLGRGLISINTSRFTEIDTDLALQEYTTGNAQVKQAFGVDIQSSDPEWAKACYLPENEPARDEVIAEYRAFQNHSTYEFVQGDILELTELGLPELDVVWTSNVLYQIEADTETLADEIRSTLAPDGIWIVADYRNEDTDFEDETNPYVSKVRHRNNWSETLEAIESPSDLVTEVRPGQDFDLVVSTLR